MGAGLSARRSENFLEIVRRYPRKLHPGLFPKICGRNPGVSSNARCISSSTSLTAVLNIRFRRTPSSARCDVRLAGYSRAMEQMARQVSREVEAMTRREIITKAIDRPVG